MMKQRTYQYEYMYPEEFDAYVKDHAIFFVPLGLLEWHGDHLPLGLDGLKAHGICLKLAELFGQGIVLPPNYIGRPGYSSYVGTLTYSESLVNQMLTELFAQLKKVGAQTIIVITGHYGCCQVDCVKRAADYFCRENPGIRIIAQPEYEGILIDGVEPADHAKQWETSLMLYIDESKVRLDAFRNGYQEIIAYQNVPNNFYHEQSHWAPTQDLKHLASREKGKRVIQALYHKLSEKLEKKKTDESAQ